jgi:hypothetical protein
MSEVHNTDAGWGEGRNESMERSFETPGPVSLRVENASGKVEIEISRAGRTDVLIIALHPAAEELVRRARVSERSTSFGHEVTVEIPHARPRARLWSADDSAAVGVLVRVPPDTGIDVSTASASVGAHGRYGAARIHSASGAVSLDEIIGRAKVRTANGDIQLRTVGDTADVETASGDVRIGVVAAGAMIATASGDVRLGESLQGVTIKTASGDQRLDRAAAGDYLLQTVSGDIAVAVVPGSLVRFDAGSISGHVQSDIEVQSDRPAEVAGEVAELSIQAKTVSGDISVVRAAG